MDTNTQSHFIKEEGYKNCAYQDHLGNWTIGVGHLLPPTTDPKPLCWTHKEIMDQLEVDYNNALRDAYRLFPEYDTYPESVQLTIVDLSFQLGLTKLSKFVKTINYIKERDWFNAGLELLNSNYAKQVPNRAKRNSNRLINS